jgi:hypothetical protein
MRQNVDGSGGERKERGSGGRGRQKAESSDNLRIQEAGFRVEVLPRERDLYSGAVPEP